MIKEISSEISNDNWKKIVGFEMYEISKDGVVRSSYYKIPKDLKPYAHKSGHKEVKLRKDNRSFGKGVHTLVAEAFLGPKPKGMEVCHNDGDASNNKLSNLRYDTHQNNILDTIKHGTHPKAFKTHCPSGHEYNEENTGFHSHKNTSTGGKGRRCLVCHRNQERARRDK